MGITAHTVVNTLLAGWVP